MIADGYAFEYTYDLPYRYQADFKAAENDARTDERGLWSPNACPHNRLGATGPGRKKNTMKKMIIAIIGGVFLSGSLGGPGRPAPSRSKTSPVGPGMQEWSTLHEGDDGQRSSSSDRDGEARLLK